MLWRGICWIPSVILGFWLCSHSVPRFTDYVRSILRLGKTLRRNIRAYTQLSGTIRVYLALLRFSFHIGVCYAGFACRQVHDSYAIDVGAAALLILLALRLRTRYIRYRSAGLYSNIPNTMCIIYQVMVTSRRIR